METSIAFLISGESETQMGKGKIEGPFLLFIRWARVRFGDPFCLFSDGNKYCISCDDFLRPGESQSQMGKIKIEGPFLIFFRWGE